MSLLALNLYRVSLDNILHKKKLPGATSTLKSLSVSDEKRPFCMKSLIKM